jgi:hypothetical protein
MNNNFLLHNKFQDYIYYYKIVSELNLLIILGSILYKVYLNKYPYFKIYKDQVTIIFGTIINLYQIIDCCKKNELFDS